MLLPLGRNLKANRPIISLGHHASRKRRAALQTNPNCNQALETEWAAASSQGRNPKRDPEVPVYGRLPSSTSRTQLTRRRALRQYPAAKRSLRLVRAPRVATPARWGSHQRSSHWAHGPATARWRRRHPRPCPRALPRQPMVSTGARLRSNHPRTQVRVGIEVPSP